MKFYKYQGTGNDFIMIDNRNLSFPKSNVSLIQKMCDRRFGIGGDGLILLEKQSDVDFKMVYFNSDGNQSSMCGNGGRCIAKFAYHIGIHREVYKFIASDGAHEAEIDMDGIVSLKMKDVKNIRKFHNDFILDTGSPHYIKLVSNVLEM